MSKIVYVLNESLLEKEIDRKNESQMSLVAWHLKQFVFLGGQNTQSGPISTILFFLFYNLPRIGFPAAISVAVPQK